MKLKDEIITTIKDDKTLFIDLQKLLNATEGTMYRYLRNNAVRLIGMDVLNVISNHIGKPVEDLTI